MLPNRPNPAMITSPSSCIASGSRSMLSRVPVRGWMSLSFTSIRTGVRAMLTATAAIRGAVTSPGITLFCDAKENSTKANSPPCASEKANRKFWSSPMPNARPRISSTTNLIAIRPATRPRISRGEFAMRSKSIDAPTEMKNTASSRPLNGSISLSSS